MRKQTNIFFSFDFLIIYDGGSTTSPMMGKYCGDSIPPSHISSSKEIMVHFETDIYGNENGFKMEYNPTGKQNTSIQIYWRYKMQNFGSTPHIKGTASPPIMRICVTWFPLAR